MSGLARSAEVAHIPKVEAPVDSPHSSFVFDGVDISFYQLLGVPTDTDSSSERGRLKDLAMWAMDGDKTIGDGMKKLRDLEVQLGQPHIGETRLNKLWNWVRISNQIKELDKRRSALENKRSYS